MTEGTIQDTASSPTIGALAAALAKAQGAMGHAIKDRTNPHFKNTYATLASVLDAIRGPLAANGLAVVQHPIATADGAGAVTMLVHSSGEWTSSTLILPLSKRDAQGAGSAITYARRYALAAICGIAADDDDGNGATGREDDSEALSTSIGAELDRLALKGKARTEMVLALNGGERPVDVESMRAVLARLKAERGMSGTVRE